MLCNSGKEGGCEWGAGCASPTHHKSRHTSIIHQSSLGRWCSEGEGGVERMNANDHRTGGTMQNPSVRVTRPALFAQKQAVGIIVESPALRDRPPLDSNRGQCEEKGRERRGEERRVRKDDCMMSVLKDQGRMVLPSDVPPSYRLSGFSARRSFQL